MKTLLTLIAISANGFSSWAMGIIALIVAFFAPIQLLFCAIIAATILDMVTAVIKAIQNSNEKGFRKWKVIKSNKLRRTVLKLFSYISIIMMIYLAEIALFTVSVYAANVGAGLILLVELQSICENADVITKQNVFTKIFKKINDIFTKKIEDKISLKDDDK